MGRHPELWQLTCTPGLGHCRACGGQFQGEGSVTWEGAAGVQKQGPGEGLMDEQGRWRRGHRLLHEEPLLRPTWMSVNPHSMRASAQAGSKGPALIQTGKVCASGWLSPQVWTGRLHDYMQLQLQLCVCNPEHSGCTPAIAAMPSAGRCCRVCPGTALPAACPPCTCTAGRYLPRCHSSCWIPLEVGSSEQQAYTQAQASTTQPAPCRLGFDMDAAHGLRAFGSKTS